MELENLLHDFSLSHLRHYKVSILSGGERRRVEIARALANNPKFIFLDEPLYGVAPISVEEIVDKIKYLKARNIGVLITDHNVREALSIADRAYVIHSGTVIAQ